MLQLIQSYQRMPGNAMVRGFRVAYKRHVLTMDDLGTLYGQNWLNDQVKRRRETGPRGDSGSWVSGALCMGEPCTHAAPSMASCLPSPTQVMNMYGDLVMDTVPEKVGLISYFSPQKNFHSSKQLFQSLSSPFYIKEGLCSWGRGGGR